MLKRIFDFIVALIGLILSAPILVPVFLVWFQDFKSHFYIPIRVGKNKEEFKMIKLRSMIVDADSSSALILLVQMIENRNWKFYQKI